MANVSKIIRANIASSTELGQFSSALLLLRSCLAFGPEFVDQAICEYGRGLPLFDALARLGIHPDRIAEWLNDLVVELDEYTADGIHTILCTAVEAQFLDKLTHHYPDHNLVVVRHDPHGNIDRILANYGDNFRIIDLHEIDTFADPLASLLVVPVFDAGTGPLITTYPNVNRILGDDTTIKFAEVVAVDLLGCEFHFFPADMVQVPIDRFTSIVYLPISGRREIQYVKEN